MKCTVSARSQLWLSLLAIIAVVGGNIMYFMRYDTDLYNDFWNRIGILEIALVILLLVMVVQSIVSLSKGESK